MEKAWRSEEYKDFIREHKCLACGARPTIPHHESLGKAGMGIKAPDSHCLPLCFECHHKLHHGGGKTFWKSIDVKMAMIELLTEFIRRGGRRVSGVTTQRQSNKTRHAARPAAFFLAMAVIILVLILITQAKIG